VADHVRVIPEPGSAAAPSSAGPHGVDQAHGVGAPGVADSFVDLLRTVRRARARLLAAAGNDVESATQVLLRTVAAEGPMRASALAVSVQSDLSTVSRQAAALVAGGLLERRADPVDGRASLLAVTEAGRTVLAEHGQVRAAFFDQVLAGWDTRELDQFARLLRRFTAAYDQTHTAWTGGSRPAVGRAGPRPTPRHPARSTDPEGTTV
jgi:DNA-binding MarR family transcriptional regulator